MNNLTFKMFLRGGRLYKRDELKDELRGDLKGDLREEDVYIVQRLRGARVLYSV